MSQSGILKITDQILPPDVPTSFITNIGVATPVANVLEILGTTIPADSTPVITTAPGNSNIVTVEVQTSQAIVSTDATKIGLSAFNSTQFTVDANGFVSLVGSGGAAESFGMQTGITPVTPNGAGLVTFNGSTVAAGIHPVRTDGTGANTMTLEVQLSQALAATDITKVGLANFDSTSFTVDGNGFVQLVGSSAAIEKVNLQTGTTPIVPLAGAITFNGSTVAAGTNPVRTNGTGVSTMSLEVQISQAIAATDATKIGLAAFDSADFTVDANGFVSATTTGFLKTLTGNSGGAIAPVANNINTVGTGSITISGSGSTLTTQLTGLTNHAVLVGAGTATITNVGPTATAGQVLQSAGSLADPVFSTATYPSTTTINQILYSSSANIVSGLATANNGVLTTGTTGIPVITALASNGQLIIGSGSGAPIAATLTPGAGITITNAANSITIANTNPSGFPWVDVTSATQALAVNTGYVTDHTNVTYTLPASGVLGDTIIIVGKLGITTIAQNANQQILMGSASSTVGATGQVAGTNVGDCVTLICITAGASSVYRAKSFVGNWTVS